MEECASNASCSQVSPSFDSARKYLEPGRFFRWITWAYAERQVLVLWMIHVVATLMIWGTYKWVSSYSTRQWR